MNAERPDPTAASQRLTAWVHGHVQGVGFRWWTRSRALELGLVGHATNTVDGRVCVIAEGPPESLAGLEDKLRSGNTPGRVDKVIAGYGPPRGGLTGFIER